MLSYEGEGTGAKQDLRVRVVMMLACVYKGLANNTAASHLLEDFFNSEAFCYAAVHHNYLRVLIDILTETLSKTPSGGNITASTLTYGGLIDVNKICSTFYWAFRIITRSRVIPLCYWYPALMHYINHLARLTHLYKRLIHKELAHCAPSEKTLKGCIQLPHGCCPNVETHFLNCAGQ